MQNILFVCSGNVFRSMTAEYALRRALGNDARFAVSSAGTEAGPYSVWPEVRDYLFSLGIDVAAHVPRRLTTEMLHASAVAIAMGENHQRFVQQTWGKRIPLFNEFCGGACTGVLDIDEAITNWKEDREACKAHAAKTIHHIIDMMPAFVRTLRNGDAASAQEAPLRQE